MAIDFRCSECAATVRVPDAMVGRLVQCGHCRTKQTVPTVAEIEAPRPVRRREPRDPRRGPSAGDELLRATRAPVEPPPAEPVTEPTPPSAPEPVPVNPFEDLGRPERAPKESRWPEAERKEEREDSFGEPRPKEKRRRPPPVDAEEEASSARFGMILLVLILVGFGLVVGGGAAAWYFLRGKTDWQPYDSPRGGFRVDLPTAARQDIGNRIGFPPQGGTSVEGTIHRGVEFVVFWGDFPGGRAHLTDESLFTAALQDMRGKFPNAKVDVKPRMLVNGFNAQESTFHLGNETYTMRIIVAETRLFIIYAGGRSISPDNENVRRFLDSFEVTEPRLVRIGKDRAEAEERARVAEEQRKEAERLRQLKIEEERKEQARLLEIERQEQARRLEIKRKEEEEFRHQEQLRKAREASAASVLAAVAVVDYELAYLRELPKFVAEASGGIAVTSYDVAAAESQAALVRAAQLEFENGLYTGRKPEDPAALGGLQFHMAFDDDPEKGLTSNLGNRTAPLPAWSKLGPGVRGTAVYLAARTKVDLSGFGSLPKFDPTKPLTIAVWFKSRSPVAELFRFIDPKTTQGYAMFFDEERLLARPWDRLVEAIPKKLPGELATTVPRDGRWHHAAIVRDTYRTYPGSVEQFKLYLDGVMVNEILRSGHINMSLTFHPESVGEWVSARDKAAPDDPVLAVDELCVFDRAFNEIDVRRLAGKDPFPTAPAPHTGAGIGLAAMNQVGLNSVTAFDPERKTLWAVSDVLAIQVGNVKPPDPGPAYLLRYELPELTLVGKYELPQWAYRGLLDSKTNRLYLAVSPTDRRWRFAGVRERASGYGGLHLIDLATLKPNDGKQPPKLTPLGVFEAQTQFHDLRLSADGSQLFAVGHAVPNMRVYRLAANLSGKAEETDLPGTHPPSRWLADLNGKLSVVSAGGRVGFRHDIDLKTWAATNTGPAPWASADWTAVGDRVFAADGTGGGAGWLKVFSPDIPDGKHLGCHGYYVASSPDGKYVFATSDREGGLIVFPADMPIHGRTHRLPILHEMIGTRYMGYTGPMTVSPDGKWIAFRSGGVLRVLHAQDGELLEDQVELPPGALQSLIRPASEFKGLRVYLPLNAVQGGKVKDEVSGKWVGSAPSAQMVHGPRGKALRLTTDPNKDGDSWGLELTDIADSFAIGANKPFTICLWARVANPKGGPWASVVTGGRAPPEPAWLELALNHETGSGSGSISKGDLKADCQEELAKERTWHHLALVRDEDGVVRLLVDGVDTDEHLMGFKNHSMFKGAFTPSSFGLVADSLANDPTVAEVAEFCLFDRALSHRELRKLVGLPAPTREEYAGPQPYTGLEPTAPSDIKGLTFHLGFDDALATDLKESVSGKKIAVPAGVTRVDGPRGKAAHVVIGEDHAAKEPKQDMVGLPLPADAIRFPADKPFTVALWVRTDIAVRCELFDASGKEGRVRLSTERLLLKDPPNAKNPNGRLPKEGFEVECVRGEWTHLAFTRNKDGEMEVWSNGERMDTYQGEFIRTLDFTKIGLLTGRRVAVVEFDELCVFDRDLAAAELRGLAGKNPQPKPKK